MKENNKLVKFTSFVLLVAVVAMILVAGTYAKYTSTASGTDTATVAKWDIKAGKAGEEVSITGSNATVSFDLFDTILDTTGNAETDVVAGKIAPGTKGAFELSVKNDSEVNAEYGVKFTVDNSTIPLEFKVNDGAWTSSLSEVTKTVLNMGTSDIAKVEWRWAYETASGDSADTTLGIQVPEINVTASLIVTQVD